jgi:hypothetical protein
MTEDASRMRRVTVAAIDVSQSDHLIPSPRRPRRWRGFSQEQTISEEARVIPSSQSLGGIRHTAVGKAT